MIFTVGHRESYRSGHAAKVAQGKRLMKVGRGPAYSGGIAFRTPEDAQRFLDTPAEFDLLLTNRAAAEFEVWAVEADWQRDTVPSSRGWWHALIHDAPLLPLEDVPKWNR